MAFIKKTGFSNRLSKIAAFADALSHPARLAILETLAKRKSCVCGEIVDVLPLAQSTVSQHLKELRELGIIKGEIEGPRSCYCIDIDEWRDAVTDMTKFLNDLSSRSSEKECC